MATKKTENIEVTTAAAVEDPEAIRAKAEEEAAMIIAAAKAEAEKILNAAAPAEPEKPEADPMEEYVEYTAPLLPPGRKQELLVSVNGETIRMRRGIPVRIRRKFVEVIESSQRQELAAWELMRNAQEEGRRAAANL